ncbi:type III-B CRISPR module-associated protein Cmr5 [bacterium]|nr:type III-B CRISPR module-associated protein Cmr5 [bacterium]
MNNKETIINKLEKGRAEFAYECMMKIVNTTDEKKKKEYRSYIRRLPTMILTNGLGQALAFVVAKSENGNAYKLIYKQLTNYMKSKYITKIQMPQDEKEFLKWVISCDSQTYRYITQEILAFLNWLKRFAEGMIEE